MKDENIIISPDTEKQQRIPPGQRETDRFPVLHHGAVPKTDTSGWQFTFTGLVQKSFVLDYKSFMALPMVKVFSDIHCVTGWSQLNMLWEGVSSREIIALSGILPEAKYVIINAENGFTTNLTLTDFMQPDVLFAVKYNEVPLSIDHGAPVRLVVPRLYFWKSAKWVTGVEFTDGDRPGFWETRGYHNHGDPWTEERYG
ncbi:MAG: sulfite oxidase-like oxidoreductase [Dehalococcoidales bacterium]|nr:sulfite oxidase-like oxidoreductase [Dehalococcoidales bacterium]